MFSNLECSADNLYQLLKDGRVDVMLLEYGFTAMPSCEPGLAP
jgi:hypothetical protein